MLSKCKKHSDVKLLHCDIDRKSRENEASASSCSDADDFERLSITEAKSDDEVVVDTACCGHRLSAVDVSQSSETVQTESVFFTIQKPPTLPFVLTAPAPSVHGEVCRQTIGSGGVEISQVSSELITIANNLPQLMVCETFL